MLELGGEWDAGGVVAEGVRAWRRKGGRAELKQRSYVVAV